MMLTVSDYLALPRSPETWLIRPLLPVGGSMIIFGDPKVGKSYLMLQLAEALQRGEPFFGFEVPRPCRIGYVQLDTPRSLWAGRVEQLRRVGLRLDDAGIYLTDRDVLNTWPFDILNPEHALKLRESLMPHQLDVVIIDTLRTAHSGKENDSDVMQRVVNELVATVRPAALIMVSHSKKPNYESGPDLINDNRGSSAVIGAVDCVLSARKKSIHFIGRGIEEGSIKANRMENGLWESDQTDIDAIVQEVIADTSATTVRAKAKVLSERIGRSEEACRSLLRRTAPRQAG